MGILWSILTLPVPPGTLQCPGMSGLMLLPRAGEYFGTQGLEEVRCQLGNHPMCPWGHLRANPTARLSRLDGSDWGPWAQPLGTSLPKTSLD